MTIIYNRQTKPSARALARELSKYIPTKAIGLLSPTPEDFIVNWGCSELGADLNSNANSNKLIQLLKLDDCGLTPRFWIDEQIHLNRKWPVVGRKSFHSKGRGLWICHDLNDAIRAIRRGATHFTELIPDAIEFRVHVFWLNGKYLSIKASEKVEGRGIIRTHARGWRFVAPYHIDELKLARKSAKQAVACLKLDFGAVDVLVTDRAYVLEVNSAPTLTDLNSDTLARYAEKIWSRYESA